MTRTVWVKTAVAAFSLGVLVFPAFSQSKGGSGTSTPTGTGTTGTPTTAPTTVTRPTTTNTTPTTPQPTVNIPQPIFISGRVTMEDGTAPPETAVIQTVCNGVPHSEGYTDAKG